MSSNELPNSLEGWTELHLIETFKLTKNLALREMVAKELEKRLNATPREST